jgi:hypothetical protein
MEESAAILSGAHCFALYYVRELPPDPYLPRLRSLLRMPSPCLMDLGLQQWHQISQCTQIHQPHPLLRVQTDHSKHRRAPGLALSHARLQLGLSLFALCFLQPATTRNSRGANGKE